MPLRDLIDTIWGSKMFIDKIILQGFTRISQNGIYRLEADFSKVMQIILGANGSGKSSIMEQLSPLPPAVSSEFAKGGFKELHISHAGSMFKVISDYGERNGHYFECDGEVLNNWGTAQVQKSLVEQHFGLTQEYFDVLCNTKKFTTMSPIERRDWVMRLSNLDINPLMSKFIESKNRLRDAKAYMNKIAERLNIEVKNTVSEDNLKELQEQLNSLKTEFAYYSKFSEETTTTASDSLEQRSAELMDFMDNLINMYPKMPQWVMDLGIKSKEEMLNNIQSLGGELNLLRVEHEKSMHELSEINKVAEAKAKLEGVGIDESKVKIAQLNQRVAEDTVEYNRYGYSLTGDHGLAKNDYLRIFADLKTKLFELPDNSDYRYNSEAYRNSQALDVSYAARASMLKEQIYQREHAIKHIDSTEDTNCPRCEYVFKKGVGKSDRDNAVRELANYQAQLTDLSALITTNKEFLTACGDYIEQIRQIYSVMNLTPSNEGLWVEVRKLEVFRNTSFPAIELLDKHLELLDIGIVIEDTRALIVKEEDILGKAQQALDIVNSINTDNISKIDERVFELMDTIKSKEKLRHKLTELYHRLTHADDQIERLNGMFQDFNLIYLDTLNNDRAKFIKDTKFNIMKEVNFVEQELEQAKVKNMIFNDIEKEHLKAKEEFQDYSKIVENLSPNTGLIADIMNDTINNFVSSINHVIGAVWTSDVVVLPCVNKKNDLDWKFPVRVEHGMIRKDVANTSSSQKDIINLAFQLVVARQLGGSQMPLYLDELGNTMDDQHRINMMHVVSDLVEGNQCSQLFFVSHFAAFHEQFNNNQTMVVNTKNIINLPRTFNQHVTIS